MRPDGHPWLKPLRRPSRAAVALGRPLGRRSTPSSGWRGRACTRSPWGRCTPASSSPGHFRFQCHGEEVLHLEIHLGYQHRGRGGAAAGAAPPAGAWRSPSRSPATPRSATRSPTARRSRRWPGVEVPLAAQVLRGVALELERLANHVGDLGALCGDVGYLPGASWFGRLRGEFLNLLLELSGNRFGRGLLVPGGVRFDARRRAAAATSWPSGSTRAERDLRAPPPS